MDELAFVGIFVVVLVGGLTALIVMLSHPEPDLHRQAIERGYGLYCPMDGEFAWVGECEETDDDR